LVLHWRPDLLSFPALVRIFGIAGAAGGDGAALIIVMVIDASFESAAGFASRGGARVHGLVGVMSDGGGQIAGYSDVQRRAPAPVFAPWRR